MIMILPLRSDDMVMLPVPDELDGLFYLTPNSEWEITNMTQETNIPSNDTANPSPNELQVVLSK